MTEKMMVHVDARELELLDECRLFEPWLEDNIRRAKRHKKKGWFMLTLVGDEQRDVLSALEVSAGMAEEGGEKDKSIEFSILHDKIIFLTPWDFEIIKREFPEVKMKKRRKQIA